MSDHVIYIGPRRYKTTGRGLELLPVPRSILEATNPKKAAAANDPEKIQQKLEKAEAKEAKDEMATIMEELSKVSLSLRGTK